MDSFWLAVSAVAASVSTVFAAVSGWFAYRLIRVSVVAQWGQLALASWEEYGSSQMLSDLTLLAEFRKQHGEDFARKFNAGRHTEYGDVDQARRRVKTHYLKAVWLHKKGFVPDEIFLAMIDSRGINLLQNVVGPMTNETDPNNPEMPDFDHIHQHRGKLRWGEYRVERPPSWLHD